MENPKIKGEYLCRVVGLSGGIWEILKWDGIWQPRCNCTYHRSQKILHWEPLRPDPTLQKDKNRPTHWDTMPPQWQSITPNPNESRHPPSGFITMVDQPEPDPYNPFAPTFDTSPKSGGR